MDETLLIRNGITLSAKAVDLIVAGAGKKAVEIGVPMCIAVVDASGYLLAFRRSEDARLANIQMSITKAVSAALRRRATADELKLRPEDPVQSVRTTLAAGADKVTSMSGGIPIFVEDQLVGAIGVSGGSRDQDIPVAQAGIDALGIR